MARNLTPEQKASKRAYEVAWRKNNADKVREQQERKRLRAKGLMAPHVPAPLVTEEKKRRHRAERMNRAYAKQREKIATDPEYAAKYRAESNERGKSNYQRIKADPEAYQAFLAAKRERNHRHRARRSRKTKPRFAQSRRQGLKPSRKRPKSKSSRPSARAAPRRSRRPRRGR